MQTKTKTVKTRPEGITRAEWRRQTVHNKPVSANLGVIQRDGIPVEVAEAMLFTAGTKLTNAMRKNCLAARETVLGSTREGKPFQEKYANRARRASAQQLVKWAQRCYAARAKVTRDYLKLAAAKAGLDPMKLHDHAKAQRVLDTMDVEAQRLDAWMAALRAEANRRLLANDVFTPVRDDKD